MTLFAPFAALLLLAAAAAPSPSAPRAVSPAPAPAAKTPRADAILLYQEWIRAATEQDAAREARQREWVRTHAKEGSF